MARYCSRSEARIVCKGCLCTIDLGRLRFRGKSGLFRLAMSNAPPCVQPAVRKAHECAVRVTQVAITYLILPFHAALRALGNVQHCREVGDQSNHHAASACFSTS